jgi:PIN domain nuclease of toxin-antitoxin system
MKLVLDTHIWLFLLMGDKRLKNDHIIVIQKAVENGTLFLPTIVLWEVAMLEAKKRVIIKESIRDWLEKAAMLPGLNLVPIDAKIAHESANLPGEFHGDPADRLIVATTRIRNASLLTFDKRIIAYANLGFVKAV